MKAMALVVCLSAGVVAAAEGWGPRTEIYAGGAGGLLLGLVGFAFGKRIAARHGDAKARKSEDQDIWGLWVAGMLARLMLLGILAVLYWKVFALSLPPALLSLAAVYTALLFWEAGWLYRVLIGSRSENGNGHG